MAFSNSDKDDFWAVDKLVPKRKPSLSPFVTSSQVKVHTVGGEAERDPSERKLTAVPPTRSVGGEERSYCPEGHSLIKRVTIRKFIDKFDFYGNFRKAALVYYDYKTPKCDFVPYYSYMPQYSQLTSPQKAYYFYWRDEVRHGRYIKCDYSYLYLYVYEILNLPDKFAPNLAIRALCGLWREYRRTLPRIDAYFSVWIQDYCFVHELSCPMDEIRDFVFDVISGSDFKEFYLSDIADAGKDGTEAMLAYLSDYDWRSTRYADGDNREIFRNHLMGAMRRVIDRFCDPQALTSSEELATVKRDAFPHSLCTHAVKCKLEIEYVPIAKDDSLRNLITAATRYTENKLRALFGVKSRLGIKDMNAEAKSIIDGYFENIFEIERRRRIRENAPEYEKLYDAEHTKLSFADADEIELASWSTTARLVSDAEMDDTAANAPAGLALYGKNEPSENNATAGPAESVAEASKATSGDIIVEIGFIARPVEAVESTAFADVSKAPEDTGSGAALGLCAEELVMLRALLKDGKPITSDEAYERINEAFISSELGDFILEPTDEGYSLVEDYRSDIEEWLAKL